MDGSGGIQVKLRVHNRARVIGVFRFLFPSSFLGPFFFGFISPLYVDTSLLCLHMSFPPLVGFVYVHLCPASLRLVMKCDVLSPLLLLVPSWDINVWRPI